MMSISRDEIKRKHFEMPGVYCKSFFRELNKDPKDLYNEGSARYMTALSKLDPDEMGAIIDSLETSWTPPGDPAEVPV